MEDCGLHRFFLVTFFAKPIFGERLYRKTGFRPTFWASEVNIGWSRVALHEIFTWIAADDEPMNATVIGNASQSNLVK